MVNMSIRDGKAFIELEMPESDWKNLEKYAVSHDKEPDAAIVEVVKAFLQGSQKNMATAISETKNIRIVKIDAEVAHGWYVESDTIIIELSKSDWERLEKSTKNDGFDFTLAEHIMDLCRD
jgi:hypothetical protein